MAKMNWDKVRNTGAYARYRDQETVYSYDKKRDGESSRVVGVYEIDPKTGERVPVEDKPKRNVNKRKRNDTYKSNSDEPIITAKNLQKSVNTPYCMVIHVNSDELEKLKIDIKKNGHSQLVKQLADIDDEIKSAIRKSNTIFIRCSLNYYGVTLNPGKKVEILHSGIAVDIAAIKPTNIKRSVFEKYEVLYSKKINSSHVELYIKKKPVPASEVFNRLASETETEFEGPSYALMFRLNPNQFWEFENAVRSSRSVSFQCSTQFSTPNPLPQKINDLIVTNSNVAYVYNHIEKHVQINYSKKKISIGIGLSLSYEKKHFSELGEYSVLATGTDRFWSGVISVIERKQ